MPKVVTRFAPSPTGKFHVGGIRSALYNYLFAKKNNGTFLLRSEDTDPTRSKKEYEDYFLEVFQWLGLSYDAFYRQSERTALYKTYLEKLIHEEKAYISKEEPTEANQRHEVIRLKNPNRVITFHDEVLGDISVDTTDLGDFVIARSMESPLYHLTVVIDDYEMGVTHVIRGQEHVSNTPRQILIQEAIGAKRPLYAHASIILNNERAKLSKRDPLVQPALEYRDQGYLPEALLNFMALLGWNPGTEQEIFSLDELVEVFSLERMQKPGAVFNPEKLEWINKEHMNRWTSEEFATQAENYIPESIRQSPYFSEEKWSLVIPLLRERIHVLYEIPELVSTGEFACFFNSITYDATHLVWKKATQEETREHLAQLQNIILSIDETTWSLETVQKAVMPYAEEKGKGNVLWPLRFSLSGQERSSDPFTLMYILGKTIVLERLAQAQKSLA